MVELGHRQDWTDMPGNGGLPSAGDDDTAECPPAAPRKRSNATWARQAAGIECISNRAGHGDHNVILFSADGCVLLEPFRRRYWLDFNMIQTSHVERSCAAFIKYLIRG